MKNIKELIEQATSYDPVSGPYSEVSFDEEKFAELIIKECIRLVSEPSGTPEYKIKNYFGIDE